MKNNELGPDLFGFYTSEVAELLSQDDDTMPFPLFARSSHPESGHQGSSLTFRNGIGPQLSEFKRKRLSSLLKQSACTFIHEEEEMAYSVLSACQMRSLIKSKSTLDSDVPICNAGNLDHGHKKKLTPSLISEDLCFLLKSDSTKVEALIEKHSRDLADTLFYMEQKIEELLNTTMTSCRPMTAAEKVQLRKLIENFPARNLDGIAEILGRKKTMERPFSNEMLVNLDEEDNVTLWRLCFYCQMPPPETLSRFYR